MANPKPQLFVLDPYHADAITFLQTHTADLDIVYPDDPNALQWHTRATGLLIRSDTRITASDLSRAPQLRIIVKQGVGIDNIDLEAAKAHGIVVCNTPALNSETVAELTLAFALNLARRVGECDRKLRRGEMIVRSQMLGQSLFRKTLGVVGMGNIGKVVAKKWAGAMEGSVIAYDPFAPQDAWVAELAHRRVNDLGELLRESDVVTLHVPLTPGTRGMISEPQFALLKPTAILLNCARGGLVDERALLRTLKEGRIYGAGLDAMEAEPPTLEAYWDMLENENVLLTPHVGASTEENQSRSGVMAAETVVEALSGGGEVRNRVV